MPSRASTPRRASSTSSRSTTARSEATQAIQTYSANAGFTGIWPAGSGPLTTNATGQLSLTVPALSAVVYRADAAVAADTSAPDVTITVPATGAALTGLTQLEATLGSAEFAEVTFAVKAGDADAWTVLGTDDNAPYRVSFDASGLSAGTPLRLKAVVMDGSGNLASDTATAVVGEAEGPGAGGGASDYAVVHYNRPDGDYAGWGVHFFGAIDDPNGEITWANPRPLAGEDDYGRFAWVKLAANPDQVGFIVHQGDTKDPGPDMFFNPSLTPEVWVRSGDPTVYTSEAAAEGVLDIHYERPDGDYTGWGLHLWGDAIADGVATEWTAPRPPDAIDGGGAHWRVPLKPGNAPAGLPVTFIIHQGDTKDPGPDQSVIPAAQSDVWVQSGDTTLYPTRGDAEDFAGSTTTATTATTPAGACTRGPAIRIRTRNGRARSCPSASTASGRCSSSTPRTTPRSWPTSSTRATPRTCLPTSSWIS